MLVHQNIQLNPMHEYFKVLLIKPLRCLHWRIHQEQFEEPKDDVFEIVTEMMWSYIKVRSIYFKG
ncbi:MAG: hypothetical protein IPH96_17890 [Saprospiraceae bacterium]|nr:hypothetical protein [Saprospiraceae bacterium]